MSFNYDSIIKSFGLSNQLFEMAIQKGADSIGTLDLFDIGVYKFPIVLRFGSVAGNHSGITVILTTLE